MLCEAMHAYKKSLDVGVRDSLSLPTVNPLCQWGVAVRFVSTVSLLSAPRLQARQQLRVSAFRSAGQYRSIIVSILINWSAPQNQHSVVRRSATRMESRAIRESLHPGPGVAGKGSWSHGWSWSVRR